MSGPVDTADMAVSTDGTSENETPGFAAIEWYARYFNRPYSAAAVAARLPAGADLRDPLMLTRALAAIGLKSQLVKRAPRTIDQIALPYILLRSNQTPLVLTAITHNGKNASVADPEKGGKARDVTMRALQREIRREVLLVTQADDRTSRMLSPDANAAAAQKGHWFWAPVRANWGNWIQVLVAALLLNLLTLALPLFVMNVYDKVIPNLAFVTLWTLAVGVGIALILDLLLRTVRSNILENIGRRVDLKVAARLFEQAMNVRLLSRPGGAAGIASTIRDFEMVREFFASATFVSVIDLLFIGIFVAVLFAIVGPIAFVPLTAVPVVFVLALIAQIPIGRSAARAQQMATKRHVVLVESLASIETIKSLNAEPFMQQEWEAAVTASSHINGRTKFWSSVATNGTVLVQQAVSVCIIIWGVFLVSRGEITIGGLIAANILAGRVLAPLGTIAQTIFRAQYAFKSLAALNRFMALPVERDTAITRTSNVVRGSISLQDVCLTYPEAKRPALSGLSFEMAPGEVVALLGKVGSGKTTTGKVISGLLEHDSGTILIDGIAQSQYEAADLRRGIGYLPQNPDLFTGTLRENLLIGEANASDEALTRALYFAALDDFLTQTPEGLDMFIGEQGNRLSGGQRQGLALARLLLRGPRLLFLDEPTNAMDQQMEAAVITRLRVLNQEGTGLIICTHRQSLAAMASRLLVMDQGRMVLDGPRAEVLHKLRAASATRAAE
ncbi:type I secretion system permease/ATPase [Sulfitobacter sp. SK012]|uniref:type I secretion system permease/ATPase n=1 Tax=Sulfitobacter sp. SK012 TaxID=1389005 RepID=UPI000E0BA8B5|nr:type I secretion system permease/ATPase [Sulfitobacter sp. SK012]AXI46326.1 type I secretion system permease/ATPase [Sulfitobacter sp. SK012]